jgi:hypothetical protein
MYCLLGSQPQGEEAMRSFRGRLFRLAGYTLVGMIHYVADAAQPVISAVDEINNRMTDKKHNLKEHFAYTS